MQSKASEWQARRARLNHDWLKNIFLPAIREARNIALGRLEDSEAESAFLNCRLPVWQQRYPTILNLLNTCEDHVSPRACFRLPPLSLCDPDTLVWLPDLVHTLWLSRTDILGRIDAVKMLAQQAQEAYEMLEGALQDRPSFVGETKVANALSEFDRACLDLSDGISSLPSAPQLL